VEFHEHFAFDHVDEHALGMRKPAGLHALSESLCALPRKASKGVLREVAWHRHS
jgi:hypothetical protein